MVQWGGCCNNRKQVKGISRYQGRLRRRVAGYAPWQWFSGCLLMVGYTQIRPLSDCIACVSCSIPTSLYTKKQTDEPSAFLHGAGEGNIPLSRSPSAPRCGLRALTAVFWVFACDMVHPDSPPLRLYGLRLGFNSTRITKRRCICTSFAWSRWRELNPRRKLGKLEFYH